MYLLLELEVQLTSQQLEFVFTLDKNFLNDSAQSVIKFASVSEPTPRLPISHQSCEQFLIFGSTSKAESSEKQQKSENANDL